MTKTTRELDILHRRSIRHRPEIERSDLCGCFYCGAIFPPSAITAWVDGPNGDDDLQHGVTALCPKCGIDAVLPSAANISITPELLAEMREEYF
jgi:hypothetical protein